MRDASITADVFITDWQRFRFVLLARKHGVPLIGFLLDGQGFHLAQQIPMQLQFDRATRAELQTDFDYPLFMGGARRIIQQLPACLIRVGETARAPLALKTWVSWGLSFSDTPKGRLESLIQSLENLLQNVSSYLLVFGPNFMLDLRKGVLLSGILDGMCFGEFLASVRIIVAWMTLDHQFIGVSSLLYSGVVPFWTPVQDQEPVLLRCLSWIHPVLERLSPDPCPHSIYLLTIASVISPTVPT